ncbi:MAG: hypothetical protein AAF549_02670 [Pseudomonadota bacterium]
MAEREPQKAQNGDWEYDPKTHSFYLDGLKIHGLQGAAGTDLAKLICNEPLPKEQRNRLKILMGHFVPDGAAQEVFLRNSHIFDQDNHQARANTSPKIDTKDKGNAVDLKKVHSKAFTSSKVIALEIYDDDIILGPWRYQPSDNDKIYYEDTEINLPKNQQKLLVALIKAKGVPQTGSQIAKIIFSDDSDIAVERVGNTYARLLNSIEKIIPDSSQYFQSRSTIGFSLLPYKSPIAKNLAEDDLSNNFAGWTFHKEYQFILRNQKVIAFRDFLNRLVSRVSDDVRVGVDTQTLNKHMYGSDIFWQRDGGKKQTRRILLEADSFQTKALEAHRALDLRPIWYSASLGKFFINYNLEDLSEQDRQTVGLKTYGRLSFSAPHGRIWINSQPMLVYQAEWKTFVGLLETRGELKKPSQVAANANIPGTKAVAIQTVRRTIDSLRTRMNSLSAGIGDQFLVTIPFKGSALCLTPQEYQKVISHPPAPSRK